MKAYAAINKKDIIQIIGIGILLVFLILPAYWTSQYLLYYWSAIYDISVWVFPICFLSFGITYGFMWNYGWGFGFAVIVMTMMSSYLFCSLFWSTEYYRQLCNFFPPFVGSISSLIAILLFHGILALLGYKLAYYGETK